MNGPLPGFPLLEPPLFPALIPSLSLSDEAARVELELQTGDSAVFDFPDPDLDARIERITAISDGRVRPNRYLGEEMVQANRPGGAEEALQPAVNGWLSRLSRHVGAYHEDVLRRPGRIL